MARLRLTVHGDVRSISVDSFVSTIRHSLGILEELDRALSHQRRGTLQWVVSSLGIGSTFVEVESRVFHGEEDFSDRVASQFTGGIRQIIAERVTPPYFSIDSMRHVRDMIRLIGRDGVQSVTIRGASSEDAVELTREAEEIVQSLVGVHHKSLGAVEGRLELISLHKRDRRFNIYHDVTNLAVRCNLPKDIERTVVKNLSRRVIVRGVVFYNVQGRPLSIKVESLRTLHGEKDLPSIVDILGIAPDMTSDLTTEQHVRKLRDG